MDIAHYTQMNLQRYSTESLEELEASLIEAIKAAAVHIEGGKESPEHSRAVRVTGDKILAILREKKRRQRRVP
jgi:hypothetical protein